MNLAITMILVPALLVAIGYVLVFRTLGMAPGYVRLLVIFALFCGGLFWRSQRSGKGAQGNAR